MYSKQEKAQLKEAFWTALGRYMTPHPGAGGEKVNWINYKTRIRHITFRTEVADSTASIAVVLSHPDRAERAQAWQQFQEVKHLLKAATDEDWLWEEAYEDEYGHAYSRIYTTLENVNIYRQEDWPTLISFFKPRLIALDAFWEEVKFAFEL